MTFIAPWSSDQSLKPGTIVTQPSPVSVTPDSLVLGVSWSLSSEDYDKFFHKESQHILVETSPCQRGCFATISAFKQGWDNHNNYLPLAKWSGTRFFLRFSQPPFWSEELLKWALRTLSWKIIRSLKMSWGRLS